MVHRKLITTKELADILDVTTQTVYNMAHEGLPRIKLGYNTVRYDPEEVMEWLKTRGQKHSNSKGKQEIE